MTESHLGKVALKILHDAVWIHSRVSQGKSIAPSQYQFTIDFGGLKVKSLNILNCHDEKKMKLTNYSNVSRCCLMKVSGIMFLPCINKMNLKSARFSGQAQVLVPAMEILYITQL